MKLDDTDTGIDAGAAASAVNGTRQMVTFALGAEEYGIDIAQVQEINRMVPITHVPRAAAYMEGVINLRGQLIPVIDLRTRFSMSRIEPTRMSRIIVIEASAKRIGMIVDSVSEVVHIPLSQIEPTPDIMTVSQAEFLSGVGKLAQRLIILLNVDAILKTAEY